MYCSQQRLPGRVPRYLGANHHRRQYTVHLCLGVRGPVMLPFAAQQKRGLLTVVSQFIASVEVVSYRGHVPSRGMNSLLFDSTAPDLHMN